MQQIALKPLAIAAIAAFVFSSCTKAPEADFTFSVSGNDVDFTENSTGDVDSYTWDFGDGETSNVQNPGHTYASSGDYEVSLTVENKKGSDVKTKTVTIEGASSDLLNFPDLPGADGMCVATNTSSWQSGGFFPIEIKVGSAIAFFYNGLNTVSVGAVDIDGKETSVVGDNFYLYQDLSGQALTAPIEWSVAGGNGFDAFTKEATANFPSVAEITSGDITTSQDYTLELDGFISGADSAFILIVGADNQHKMTVANGFGSYQISASDLSNLGATDYGSILISAYNYTTEDVGGKTIYFVNQSSVSKIVKID